MGLAGAVRTCLSKYVTFSGRALRSEFWYFVLFIVLGSFVASALDVMLFGAVETTTLSTGSAQATATTASGPSAISTVFSLAMVVPFFAATWRRLHDTGRSGLMCLLPHAVFLAGSLLTMIAAGGVGMAARLDASGALNAAMAGGAGLLIFGIMVAPVIAYIVLTVWLASRGEPDANRFGPPPLGA